MTEVDDKRKHDSFKNHSQTGPTPVSRVTFHKRRRLVRVPQNDEEAEVAKKLDYVLWIEDKLKLLPYSEFAEHGLIGDNIYLKWTDGNLRLASKVPFTLPNGLRLTYGQINALAGDFYGTVEPISDGENLQIQVQRFMHAYDWLATDTTRQPDEANAILAMTQAEVDAINKALAKDPPEDPSKVYNELPNVVETVLKYEYYTLSRPQGFPSYLGLALINWDHFGIDAHTAYDAGHHAALQTALDGDLLAAYALNAFADHYLEDSFSAGHMRTPRRGLHGGLFNSGDLCAEYMHDEDNAIGLQVVNPNGQSWIAYGDSRLFDKADIANKNQCMNALKVSADEIYQTWSSKQMPLTHAAWNYAPTLESAAGKQVLAPLFKPSLERRKVIKLRREWDYVRPNGWWFPTTAALLKTSGLWKYPIDIGE